MPGQGVTELVEQNAAALSNYDTYLMCYMMLINDSTYVGDLGGAQNREHEQNYTRQ